jgi:hypothetical protein
MRPQRLRTAGTTLTFAVISPLSGVARRNIAGDDCEMS